MEGRIVIAQRLSIHQRKVQQKESRKKGRKAAEVYPGMTIDDRAGKGQRGRGGDKLRD